MRSPVNGLSTASKVIGVELREARDSRGYYWRVSDVAAAVKTRVRAALLVLLNSYVLSHCIRQSCRDPQARENRRRMLYLDRHHGVRVFLFRDDDFSPAGRTGTSLGRQTRRSHMRAALRHRWRASRWQRSKFLEQFVTSSCNSSDRT
jgi:hypothetical protein